MVLAHVRACAHACMHAGMRAHIGGLAAAPAVCCQVPPDLATVGRAHVCSRPMASMPR